MVRPKLSYDEEVDRKTAVAAYIRSNVALLKFTGSMRNQRIKILKNIQVTSLSQKCEKDNSMYEVDGAAVFVCIGDLEDDEFETFNKFSCSCKLVRSEQDEPVISDVSLIECIGY